MVDNNNPETVLDDLLMRHMGLILINNAKESNNELFVEGPVNVSDNWFYIEIEFKLKPQLKYTRVKVRYKQQIKHISSNSSEYKDSIYQLIDNLPKIFKLEEKTSKQSSQSNVNGNIFNEIVELKNLYAYRMQINEDYSRLRLDNFQQINDHYLDIQLLPSIQVVDVSLPNCINFPELCKGCTTLKEIVENFIKCLEDLKIFYNNLLSVDELCYVLQPQLPTTKENWRIIQLEDRIYLKIKFSNPFAPLASMSLQIVGRAAKVTDMRRALTKGLQNWDINMDVYGNLLRIFEVCYFPMAPTGQNDSSTHWCSICYSYEMENGEIPLIFCNNVKCDLIFHAACLKTWFNTLADSRNFLDVSFATCPFCKEKLSTSFEELWQ